MATLNLDVLASIATFCTTPDVLQLGYSSHVFREVAVTEVLSRPVHLRRYPKVVAFGSFILGRNPSRLQLLRSLTVEHMRDADAHTTNIVVQILQGATQLRVLRLNWCDTMFIINPQFAEAITALPDLREFHIYTGDNNPDLYIAPAVLGLRPQLKVLSLPMYPDNQFGPSFPNHVAQHLRELERLSICYLSMSGSAEWTPFSSVHTLYLTIGDCLIDLKRIVQAFPNLRDFSIQAHVFEVDIVHPSPEIMQSRSAAIALQRAGRGWRSLDCVSGSIGDLWTLGLTCPVQAVRLGQYDTRSHAAFVDVVVKTRPRMVVLDMYCAPWYNVGLSQPSILLHGDDESAGFVSHMMFCMSVSASHPPGVKDFLATVCPFLERSRLQYLHLAIGEFFLRPDLVNDERFFHPRDVPAGFQKSMAAVDIPALISEIAAKGTSLQTIVLSLSTQGQSVWSICRSGGRPTLRRLGEYDGRLVIEREERAK